MLSSSRSRISEVMYLFTPRKKERIAALRTDGVMDSVRFNGSAAKVNEQEIKSIKDFLGEHSDVEVRGIEPGDRVLFYKGALQVRKLLCSRLMGIS